MANLSELIQSQNFHLDSNLVQKVVAFGDMVVRYNQKANLISAGDEAKIASRHLLDSLQPLRHPNLLPSQVGAKWADLGSGAGFPVLPLCIALPQIEFYAVEPRQKRFTFLKLVRSELGLKNLNIVESNAEESGLTGFDRVSCRALGSAEEDWKRANVILAENGLFVTLKSLRDCEGYTQPSWTVLPYELPGETQPYCLLVRKKDHG